MIRDTEIRERYPYWSEDNVCLRCGKETEGDEIPSRGMLYCWPCRREGSRNSGVVGPIFGYGGWC